MGNGNTKEKLELQALRFFAVNDFERSSLTDIAKALNVTKGAIYHYFDGKDDLFLASVNRLIDIMEDWFSKSLPGDIAFRPILENLFMMEEAMKELGETLGLDDVLGEYQNILYLFLASLKKFPQLRDRLDKLYGNFKTQLIHLINAGIVKGELHRDLDVEAIAFEITAFYEGAMLLSAFSNQDDYKVLGQRVCKSILDRICISAGDGRIIGEDNE